MKITPRRFVPCFVADLIGARDWRSGIDRSDEAETAGVLYFYEDGREHAARESRERYRRACSRSLEVCKSGQPKDSTTGRAGVDELPLRAIERSSGSSGIPRPRNAAPSLTPARLPDVGRAGLFPSVLHSKAVAEAVAWALGIAFKLPRETALQIARSSQEHLAGPCLVAACLGTVLAGAVAVVCCLVELLKAGGGA